MKIKYSFLGSKLFSFVVVFLLSILISPRAETQFIHPSQKKLYTQRSLHMDSVLFNAFNTRDLNTVKTLIHQRP
jgi:hypothetical protein